MNQRHYDDMLALTLAQMSGDTNRLFLRLLSSRLKECCEGNTYAVLYYNDLLTGFVRWTPDGHTMIMDALVIADDYRGQGHLMDLWAKFLDKCGEAGAKEITSYISRDNHLSISLHENLGFYRLGNPGEKQEQWVYKLSDKATQSAQYHRLLWLRQPDFEGEL